MAEASVSRPNQKTLRGSKLKTFLSINKKWLAVGFGLIGVLALCWSFWLFNHEQACYVRAQHLQCVDKDGGTKRYSLPRINGIEPTNLIPSPDRSHYVAMANENVSGLGTGKNGLWIVDSNFNVVHELHPFDSTSTNDGRTFALWSPDGSKVLIKSSSGSDFWSLYDLTSGQNIEIGSVPPCNMASYQFIDNEEILTTCEYGGYLEQPSQTQAHINPIGGGDKKIGDFDNAYGGSFVVLNNGKIIFHDGKAISSVNANGEELAVVADDIEFSYYKYDSSTDSLYLVQKQADDADNTLGIKAVGVVNATEFLNGSAKPSFKDINSPIHAQDASYVVPTSRDSVLLFGWNGVEQYDLQSGQKIGDTLPAPAVIPGDVTANLEGVVGLVKLQQFPVFGKETTNDRIRDLDIASINAGKFLGDDFKVKDEQCKSKPDRYGSLLEARVMGADEQYLYVVFGCTVTGYWGRASFYVVYENQDGDWKERPESGQVGDFLSPDYETRFPECAVFASANIPAHIAQECFDDMSQWVSYEEYLANQPEDTVGTSEYWVEATSGLGGFTIRIPDGWRVLNVMDSDWMIVSSSEDSVYEEGVSATVEETESFGTDGAQWLTIDLRDEETSEIPSNMERLPDSVKMFYEKYYYKWPLEYVEGIGSYPGAEEYLYRVNSDDKTVFISHFRNTVNQYNSWFLEEDEPNIIPVIEEMLRTLTIN